MNFQQLRIIRETLRHNYNLTEAAQALLTSQSGVSKHIRDLEEELGVEIFIRRGKRLLGLTDPGKEVAAITERILLDSGETFAGRDLPFELGHAAEIALNIPHNLITPKRVRDSQRLTPQSTRAWRFRYIEYRHSCRKP